MRDKPYNSGRWSGAREVRSEETRKSIARAFGKFRNMFGLNAEDERVSKFARYHFAVTEVANGGFMLEFDGEVYFAKDLDELEGVVRVAMVKQKVLKK